MIGRHRAPEIGSLWELLGLGSPEETAWMADALCAQTDPELFFPEKGGSTRTAKSVCLACPVRDECETYALDRKERHGVWGGLSERERRSAQRKQATDSVGEVAA